MAGAQFNGDGWRAQRRYCSQFIKLTLHVSKLNEFSGDSINANYKTWTDTKMGCGVIAG